MNNTKEVYFDQYCSKCKYKDADETMEPCDICLEQGFNLDSHKPVMYKEEENGWDKKRGF